jgi:CubicO group peptidase (beta-lactamase class C family)
MARFLADDGPPGVSVAIVRDGDTLVAGGSGLADRDSKIAATADTSYRIGSISKQFTAAMTMRLVEQGKIALADAVGQHLPQLPSGWRSVTVLQLLNHTSGIPDYTELGDRWREHWQEALSPAQILALVADDRMDFAPGSKWQYSNTGYVVLGTLLEQISGRPYGQILQDDISRPLGLTRTRVCEDAPGANGQALGHMAGNKGFGVAPYRHASHAFGGGGICSTAGDLAIWNRALNGGKVVNAASYGVMTPPQGVAATGSSGFGLELTSHDGHRVISAHGAGGGFTSGNAWYPDDSLSVTVLTNGMPLQQEAALLRNLGRVALGIPIAVTDASAAPALDEAALRVYAGRYTIQGPKGPLGVRLWVDGKQLKAQAEGQAAFVLRSVGPHTFGTALDPTVMFTFTVENGVVTKLVFGQGGRKFDTVKR